MEKADFIVINSLIHNLWISDINSVENFYSCGKLFPFMVNLDKYFLGMEASNGQGTRILESIY